MRYIIYGVNRVSKDFIYIFEQLDIVYFIEENPALDNFLGYCVKSIENALNDNTYDKIIICGFEKTDMEENLKKHGLIYEKNYLFDKDFFEMLDNIHIPKNRKVAIWGMGNRCKYFLNYAISWEISIFIDSYKKQDIFNNHLVYLPNEIADWKEYCIIIALEKDTEIKEFLNSQGLVENIDFFSYRTILQFPSVLLYKTIFDQSSYDLVCNTMQNHLEILENGNTRCCCTTFVSQSLNNIFDMERDELWNSVLHKILCLSTENKTFSFCDKSMCPLFVAKQRSTYDNNLLENTPYSSIKPFPETLALGYDPSCNLACSTCRNKLHFAQGKEMEMVNRISCKVIKDYLPYCKFLILAGNGEVFVSPSYQRIYKAKECSPQYIRLLTNGTLFTLENWNNFKAGNDAKVMLTISVDAVSKETYKYIRKGNFEQLKQNMKFASELRAKGELSYFRINFVVQKKNYKEMIKFVQWGQALGVDEVFFTKILNWGTYTPEEFEDVSMMEKDGVTPKQELREILEHPIMKSSIVDFGTIQFGHKIDDIGIVENYYMWELEKRGGKLFL